MPPLRWSAAATGLRSTIVNLSRRRSRLLSASVKSGNGGRSASMRSVWPKPSPSRWHRTSSSWSRRSIWSRHQPAWSAIRHSRRANRNSRWLWRTSSSNSRSMLCRSKTTVIIAQCDADLQICNPDFARVHWREYFFSSYGAYLAGAAAQECCGICCQSDHHSPSDLGGNRHCSRRTTPVRVCASLGLHAVCSRTARQAEAVVC